jgi:flagella basal body P-ring formation protein FlgA
MTCLISILFALIIGQSNYFDIKLKNYLDENLKTFVKYEYQIVKMPKSFTKIEINYEKTFRHSKNYSYVPIEIIDKNNLMSQAFLVVKLKLYKNVLFASKRISKSQDITSEMFITKLKDVSDLSDNLVEATKDISKYRSRVFIKEGTILTEELIEPIPIVKIGDKVVLHSGRNGVDISMEVIARQEGCIGDIISVSNFSSKLYKARIIDKFNLILEE